MQEYAAHGLVLAKEASKEMDFRVTLFTDQFGKVFIKAKSARKITSKLSAHLEPGNLVSVRLIEKGGLQATDALKERRLPLAPHDLYALDRLLPVEEPDPELWELLRAYDTALKWEWTAALAALGWDPRETRCEKCHVRPPLYFALNTQSLYCASCAAASRIPADALLYIGDDRG